LRKLVLIRREISFFFSALLMLLNGRPLGRISAQQGAPDGGVDQLGLGNVNSPVSACP
jgi:hypothetical protein